MNPTMLALLLALGLATGPSTAGYRIVPVAVNERGEVLFRTWRELNPEGAQAFRRGDVGWLVVSAKGLWREVPHAVAPDTARGDDGDSSRNAALRQQFEAPLAWDDPPASVAPLLREFGCPDAAPRGTPPASRPPTLGLVDPRRHPLRQVRFGRHRGSRPGLRRTDRRAA